MKAAFLCALAAVVALAAGCGTARRGEPFGRVVADGQPSLMRGEALFQQHCHQCHPGGEGGLGPAMNDKPLPAWLIKTQIRAGLGVMPSFPKEQISSEELDALAAYVVALRKAD